MLNRPLRFVSQVKAGKLFKHPVWKSSWFVLGLMAIGFGLWGTLFPTDTEIIPLNDLKVYTGVITKVELWRIKNSSGYRLFLSVAGAEKRFGVDRCEYHLDLISPGDTVTVYTDTPFITSFVDGAIWQIVKSGTAVCAYNEVVKNQKRGNKYDFWLALFVLIAGVLTCLMSFYRTKQKMKNANQKG